MQQRIKSGTQEDQINLQTVIPITETEREIILNASDYLEGPEQIGGAGCPSL